MTHPTRLRTMRVLAEGPATPRQIAEEIDEPVNNVAYHVKILARLGCVELVEPRPAEAAESPSRSTWPPSGHFYDDAWAQLGDREKLTSSRAIMQHVTEDIAAAM